MGTTPPPPPGRRPPPPPGPPALTDAGRESAQRAHEVRMIELEAAARRNSDSIDPLVVVGAFLLGGMF